MGKPVSDILYPILGLAASLNQRPLVYSANGFSRP